MHKEEEPLAVGMPMSSDTAPAVNLSDEKEAASLKLQENLSASEEGSVSKAEAEESSFTIIKLLSWVGDLFYSWRLPF